MLISLEDSAPSAMVRAGDEAATNEPRLPKHTALSEESAMSETRSIRVAGDESSQHAPNVGHHHLQSKSQPQPEWARLLEAAAARRREGRAAA